MANGRKRKRLGARRKSFQVEAPAEATEPVKKTPAQREALAGALAAFIPDKHGTEQPVWLRRYLRPLESNGYIRYDSEGWHLTDKGKFALKW